MTDRTILTPIQVTDFAGDGGKGGLTYWKQILPAAPIIYNADGQSRRIDFSEPGYLDDLVMAFKEQALPQTPFMLADTDNKHTMDPERYRGEVVDMRKYDDLPAEVKSQAGSGSGVWGKIRFSTKEDADAVLRNPKLGVSARIREGLQRADDGKTFKRAIIHVLGTLDPRVTRLREWMPSTDLSSTYDSANVLDLTTAAYTEAPLVETKDKITENADGSFTFDIEAITEDDIEAMTDEQVLAFLEATSEVEDTDEDETDETDETDDGTEIGDGQTEETELSNTAKADIDLATATANEAMRRANEAQKRAAAAEWKSYRSEMLRAGVPADKLDLAQPVLERLDDMVIDLSNSEQDDINASQIVRALLDGYKGTIPVGDVELGHGGTTGSKEDPDAELDAIADKDPRFSRV